jgi:hypothetical protein
MVISMSQMRGSRTHRTLFGLRNEKNVPEDPPATQHSTARSKKPKSGAFSTNCSVPARQIGGTNGAVPPIAAVLPYVPMRVWKLAISLWCLSSQNVWKASANERLTESLSNYSDPKAVAVF